MGSISYRKLWYMLIDKKMSKYQLRIDAGISPGTMAKMSQGHPVTLRTVSAICDVLHCQPGDILEYMPEPWPDTENPKSQKCKKVIDK